MSRKLFFTLMILLGMFVIAACNATPTPEPTTIAYMANPASVLCEQSGGKVDIRTDAAGGQTGFCIFPDASECEEWAFFRGECKAGDSLTPVSLTDEDAEGMPNPASVFCDQNGGVSDIIDDINGSQSGVCFFPDGSECEEWAFFRGECKAGDNLVAEDGWKVYRNLELGYSFHYPVDCLLSTADNLENTLTVTGPLADNENWPVIYFNHPQGRAEFAPPVDANLEQWLKDNNLLVEERMEDTEIAGTSAIHIHHPRSEQSYASDTFFFAHNGQLYSVVFLHTGDKEDWDLYNHFLENIQFEK
jgi:putative hemolysin